MMPLKAAAMPWAFIMLLVATSSTCNGLSVRKLQQAYSSTATSPDTINLKTAERFTVLAYSTVTNTGPTTIGGVIGVSPGLDITGTNTMTYDRADKETAAAAKADVNEAYLDASGRVDNVVTIGVVNIGGITFTPGLYKTEGSLEVSSGTVYLSGNGTFIFQMAKELVVGTGLEMILQDGALARNIFWRVGSSATFEVGCDVKGTVMAEAKIAVKTGAKVTGRLFSVNAAVTMDSNTVVFPE